MFLIDTVAENISSCTIHEDAKFIGSNVFYNCPSLQKIIIPTGIRNVSSGTFWGCTGITDAVVPCHMDIKTVFGSSTKLTNVEVTHEWGEWNITKEPTSTEEGMKISECVYCNDKRAEKVQYDPTTKETDNKEKDSQEKNGEINTNNDISTNEGNTLMVVIVAAITVIACVTVVTLVVVKKKK